MLAVMDDWWGGLQGQAGSQQRALLLPRLFLQHFRDTSYVVEKTDGEMVAFLIGFRSGLRQSRLSGGQEQVDRSLGVGGMMS